MPEHGGYRPPANPAPVSGPGALSARTDGVPAGQVTGLAYGTNGPLNEMAASAPMAQPGSGLPSIVPLDAESAFPDEPITAGAPFGPGPGPRMQNGGRITDLLQQLMGDDIVGAIEEMFLDAEARGL